MDTKWYNFSRQDESLVRQGPASHCKAPERCGQLQAPENM